MTITAVNFRPDGDWYVVRFGYDPELVALIKTLPISTRRWRPEDKSWLVHGDYVDRFANELTARGYAFTGHTPDDDATLDLDPAEPLVLDVVGTVEPHVAATDYWEEGWSVRLVFDQGCGLAIEIGNRAIIRHFERIKP
jgi:hypothetical protein